MSDESQPKPDPAAPPAGPRPSQTFLLHRLKRSNWWSSIVSSALAVVVAVGAVWAVAGGIGSCKQEAKAEGVVSVNQQIDVKLDPVVKRLDRVESRQTTNEQLDIEHRAMEKEKLDEVLRRVTEVQQDIRDRRDEQQKGIPATRLDHPPRPVEQ